MLDVRAVTSGLVMSTLVFKYSGDDYNAMNGMIASSIDNLMSILQYLS